MIYYEKGMRQPSAGSLYNVKRMGKIWSPMIIELQELGQL